MSQSSLKRFTEYTISTDSSGKINAAPPLRVGIRPVVLIMLLLALLVLFILRIAIGSVSIPVADIISVLLGGEASKATWANIILNIRLPRALTAVFAGAALSVGGLMMQTLFRNALAGPDMLGISAGASLGVALVVLSTGTIGGTLLAGIGLGGDVSLVAAACAGAGLTLLLIMLVARQVRSTVTLLILGLMFSFFATAIVSLLLHFAIPEQIQAYVNWTLGSFDGVTWGQMGIFVGGASLGLLMAFMLVKPLNALLLGEGYARSMGLKVGRTRAMIIIATAILTGVITAFCGPIGFVGIAVPHICRALFNTAEHRVLLPASAIVGGIMALTAALVASVPGSEIILPLNPVMALLGAPVVMRVILRRRGGQRLFEAGA